MRVMVALFILVMLNACSLFEDKPNNAIAFTSDQILAVAVQVDQAYANGFITKDEENTYLDRLITANEVLGGGISAYRDVEYCQDSDNKFKCVQAIILSVQEALE